MTTKSTILSITLLLLVLTFHVGCSKNKADSAPSGEKSIMTDSARVAGAVSSLDTIADIKLPKSKSMEDMQAFINESKDSAKYKQGLIPAIMKESPEYAYKLLGNQYEKFIVVDKSRMKVVLFDKYGRMIKEYGMACAKNYGTKHAKADSRTPEGFFSIEGKYDSTDWLFTDDNGVTSQVKGQFGPRFLRLKIPITHQIGIHGTGSPWSIGHRVSHGCIRITNDNILELFDLVEAGMPVIVVPGRLDMERNLYEGYNIPWIPTSADAKRPVLRSLETLKKVFKPAYPIESGDSTKASVGPAVSDTIKLNTEPISTPTNIPDSVG